MLADATLSITRFTASLFRTILVVEDEELIRMFLTEYLEDCGYSVLVAGNVAEAKAILKTTPVDLVFSDVNMPGGETGFVLEKWIRRHHPNIKVILTSGFPHVTEDTKDLQEVMIPKPYAIASVVTRIEHLLSIRAEFAR